MGKSPSFESLAKQSKQQNTYTNIDDLTKIVGIISEEVTLPKIACVHNNFSGVLYAGPLALVFHGRIFFFEWTVVIRWENVTHVQKTEYGLEVAVHSPKQNRYEFQDIFNLEKVWSALVSIHNDSILDSSSIASPSPRQLSRNLRRMNSDPAALRLARMIRGDDQSKEQGNDKTISPSLKARPLSESISQESLVASDTKTPMKDQWEYIMHENYGDKVVEGLVLDCSLDSFFDRFLSNNASNSIEKFMIETGDEDCQCERWAKTTGGFHKSRTLEYTHPVNAPMAPPKARARKVQTYRKYGHHGLVVETRTYVSDVPMTDCFYVVDCIRVEAAPSSGGSSKVVVNLAFDIRFVKSTMFQSIITRTTKREVIKFMKEYAQYLRSCASQLVEAHRPHGDQMPHNIPLPKNQLDTVNFQALLLVTLLMLQLWVLKEMSTMKSDLHQLHLLLAQQQSVR